MAEKEKEQIRAYAERGWLEYIDGYIAQIANMKPTKNQEGEDVWEIILNPTDKLVKAYALKPNSAGNMLYRTQIPVSMLIQLNADPSNTKWLCLLTYEGKETFISDVLKGIVQQKEINFWKNKWKQEKLKAEVATEKLQLMQNNLPAYLEKNFAPIITQFEPLLSKINKDNK